MSCPRCHAPEVTGERCPRCGVVVALFQAALEKMRRPPATHAAAGGNGGVATAVAAPAATTILGAPAFGAPTAAAPVTSPGLAGAPPSEAAAPGPAAPGPAGPRPVLFHGRGSTLFGIHIVNVLRTLLTFGVYHFWGKVRVRRYVLGQVAFEGDRLAYHGTGRELALGFARAVLFVMLPITALNAGPTLLGADPLVEVAGQVLASLIAGAFVPLAMVGAHRYRLSRTSWRGIRFSFRGRTWDFVRLFWTGSFLTTLSFGLYYPVFDTRRRAFLTSHARFGQWAFRFTGRGRDLLRPYLLALLLTAPTLGLAWFWYAAKKRRYFWDHTACGTARFRSTLTGRQLMNLTIGNALLLVFTLGFAWPWVLVRKARLACTTLAMEGPLDLSRIVQATPEAGATGDALSALLGADVGLA